MKRVFKDLKSKFEGLHLDSSTAQTTMQEDMMLYRKHRGVNLGAWFVLERWITDTPYRQAASPGQSDLDVAKGKNAKAILEKHWDTWVTEKDWDWLVSVGINAVRIPIGYYHACGADRSILDGTDFYPYYDVFQGAWRRITAAILSAYQRNISVMIDLHAAPGKQNADAHSGTSLSPNFFNDPHNQRRGLYALQSITSALTTFLSSPAHPVPLNNLIGIQLLNEPAPPNDAILKSWYTTTITALQKLAPSIPIYIGECWKPDLYAEYVTKELKLPNDNAMVVLDHHLYRCFTPADIRTSVQDHTRALKSGSMPATFERISETMGRSGGGIVVGEWSGGLNPGSLRNVPNERRDYVHAQLDLYERTCGGWYFWCYKKEHPGDVGWSFREAVEKGVFPRKIGISAKKRYANFEVEAQRRDRALDEVRGGAYNAHVSYWSKIPNTYEHTRFYDGFTAGWTANYRFFDSLNPDASQVSEIGFKHALAWKSSKNHGRNYWEYEHGFLQGCDAAKADFQKVFG